MQIEFQRKPFRHASASQFTTFSPDYGGCNMLWFWEKVAGFRGPQTEPMIRGIAGHWINEQYLLHDRLPSLEVAEEAQRMFGFTTEPAAVLRMVQAGVPYLPVPKIDPLQVERGFRLTHNDWPVEVVGFLDLLHPAGHVLDYKFKSDTRWAHNDLQLGSDLQGRLYSLVAPALWAESTLERIWAAPDGSGGREVTPLHEPEAQPQRFEHLTYGLANHAAVVSGYTFQPAEL
ncbi:MAG: PD-(D/E)XK nuclease family protein, partial [Myxococcales bacterium]|nr:PD-(D/E)XK nuclease family protein [Myxococcales bacterium]